MKRISVFLAGSAIAVFLAGCIVYTPSPESADLGYTYDFGLPVAGGGASARFARSPVVAPYGSEHIPPPPRVPPVYSDIPDPLPRQSLVQTVTRTVVLPGGQAYREPAGAASGTVQPQQQVVPAAPVVPPAVIYGGGGTPIVLGDTNIFTNNIIATNISNTNVSNTNAAPANVVGTNLPPATNAFSVLPGTNVNEGAGAQPGDTNAPPAAPPLNEPAPPSAPRLPAQPRIPPASSTFPQSGATIPGETPNPQLQPPPQTQTPKQPQTAPQQQPQTAPAPEQQQSTDPFAPVRPQ